MNHLLSEKLIKLETISSNIRSSIIDRTITIEAIISELLINLLSTEKTRQSIDKYLFSDTLTFDQKIKLFNSLRKANIFDFHGNGKDIGKNLDFIKNLRNTMAHSMLNSSDEFLEKTDLKTIEYVSFTDKGTITVRIIIESDVENQNDKEYGENLIAIRINYLIDILNTFKKA
ncbi:hypothetical protein [Mangrovibacterium lignilyticum]|uniref:hypothetical protein n=1 Tax=Mangrovibacterium lignilyticum TaxID=2668052 RepID=UPI0013D30B63|nr:hypothetical protein [Mangrovibacterium lignilyticum]